MKGSQLQKDVIGYLKLDTHVIARRFWARGGPVTMENLSYSYDYSLNCTPLGPGNAENNAY